MTPGEPDLTEHAIAAWRQGERGVVSDDLKKIVKLVEGGVSVPLWQRAYGAATTLLHTHKLEAPDLGRFKSAVMSVQSSIGNSCERLIWHCALQVIEQNNQGDAEHLVRYIRDDHFFDATREARNQVSSGGSPKSIAGKLSEDFYVTPDYADELVNDPKSSMRYPDSVSVFKSHDTTRLVIAEHKLTGDNDEKAVLKNLDTLYASQENFAHKGRHIQTVVALPFTLEDRSVARRWENKPRKAGTTAVNAEVWEHLLGLRLSKEEYDRLLTAAAAVAGHRIFQWIAHPAFRLDLSGTEWSWVEASEEPGHSTEKRLDADG